MKEELYKKIYINSEADLPKAGLYFCAITDECFGCFHFNPDDKDDIDFWIGNVMWYLQPIEPVEAEKPTYTPNPPIGSTTDFKINDYGDCTFCGRAHSGKCNCS